MVVLVGGGVYVVNTAIDNANAPRTPLTLQELAGLSGQGDPFAPDPEVDILKAQAAQALRADELKEGRDGQKRKLSPVYVPEEPPKGGGFSFPPGSKPDPGSNKALGQRMNAARGWAAEWGCLEKLWEKESNWNERAMNRYSGAYGIPQSLPGTKMASAGADWQVNPATQIEWGLGYIKGRYGSPCGAWGHSQRVGWY
nr:transglycosylase SLT domain-containing protein [Sinosporangium siamense]